MALTAQLQSCHESDCFCLLKTQSAIEATPITILTTVVPIKVIGHKSTRTALCVGILLPQPLDLPEVIDLVELQHSQLHLLLLLLELLWLSVGLLLRLLGTTAKAEHQVESGLLLDVVVGQSAAVLELFVGEDEALLVRLDSLLVRRDSLPLRFSRRCILIGFSQ
ncbi:hypothetical protein Q3G72_033170 [Acer saccharum]|nr:hypothetical protein Q3G72_033170 [Acer saccharum]